MLLAFFGHAVEEHTIATLLETDEGGTEFSRIARVESYGFHVSIRVGVYGDLEAVHARSLPVIVAVSPRFLPTYGPLYGGAHSVVVAGATSEEVFIYDPNREIAPDIIPAADFRKAWESRSCRLAALLPR
jgi:ABC-type bacteriocin/lantibiotic exporter with double-glycine peptidase domain